jgi:hypothetical protein
MKKKVEEFIIKRYNQGYSRMEITRELATENDLTYSEAEPIVDSTLLKSKHLSNRLGGAFD